MIEEAFEVKRWDEEVLMFKEFFIVITEYINNNTNVTLTLTVPPFSLSKIIFFFFLKLNTLHYIKKKLPTIYPVSASILCLRLLNIGSKEGFPRFFTFIRWPSVTSLKLVSPTFIAC